MKNILVGELDAIDTLDGSMKMVGNKIIEDWIDQLIQDGKFKYGDRVEISIQYPTNDELSEEYYKRNKDDPYFEG